MGRPTKDQFFVGDTNLNTDTKPGLQIRVTLASYTGGPTDDGNSWIVRQRSQGQFEVTNGTAIEVLRFFNGTGSIPTGTFALRVKPFTSGTEYARGFTNHLVKTFQGNTYKWDHLKEGVAASDGDEVDFEPTMQ